MNYDKDFGLNITLHCAAKTGCAIEASTKREPRKPAPSQIIHGKSLEHRESCLPIDITIYLCLAQSSSGYISYINVEQAKVI